MPQTIGLSIMSVQTSLLAVVDHGCECFQHEKHIVGPDTKDLSTGLHWLEKIRAIIDFSVYKSKNFFVHDVAFVDTQMTIKDTILHCYVATIPCTTTGESNIELNTGFGRYRINSSRVCP